MTCTDAVRYWAIGTGTNGALMGESLKRKNALRFFF